MMVHAIIAATAGSQQTVQAHAMAVTTSTSTGLLIHWLRLEDQCWFQTNLNTTTFANGDAIPLIYDAQDWLDQGNAEEAAYRTIYGDDIQSEQFDRGLLYNWYSVADERGVCPSGFHVSSETDWDMLESFLGSDDADPIRAQKSWYENYTPNGSNSAGLSVMSQHVCHQSIRLIITLC